MNHWHKIKRPIVDIIELHKWNMYVVKALDHDIMHDIKHVIYRIMQIIQGGKVL